METTTFLFFKKVHKKTMSENMKMLLFADIDVLICSINYCKMKRIILYNICTQIILIFFLNI